MANYTASIEKLIECLIKLPGVGRRSAERIVAHVLGASRDEIKMLSEALDKVKESVRSCRICNNLSDEETCEICKSSARNRSMLCVVEEPNDIVTIEKAGNFNGLYHVLLGSLSPLDGIGPSELKIKELIDRVKKEKFDLGLVLDQQPHNRLVAAKGCHVKARPPLLPRLCLAKIRAATWKRLAER